ncbi:hypothetical protein DL93DRAFT_245183 [Clavulina sp. PMI_390]|nr:hypothetical protein DL93DRAFT_245183 [Clavulina sp. PMI_390]
MLTILAADITPSNHLTSFENGRAIADLSLAVAFELDSWPHKLCQTRRSWRLFLTSTNPTILVVAMAKGLIAIAALVGSFFSLASAQVTGYSSVHCIAGWDWANNTLEQNPCVITAYLQAQCGTGTFTMDPLPAGYHYIGPTNDTSTQNPCICSTPVYMLDSACGACQNRTYISWTTFSAFCPLNMVSPQGQYNSIIPAGTRVPAYAFLKPSDYGDYFNPVAAHQLGDSPESTQVMSTSTSSTSSTSSTLDSTSAPPTTSTTPTTTSSTSSRSGGGGGGSNLGAIVGGVVGGVLGLGLLVLLGFWITRGHNKPAPASNPDGYVAAGSVGGTTQRPLSGPEMTAVGHGAGPGHMPVQYTGNTAPTVMSGGSAGQGYYGPSTTSPTSPTHHSLNYSGVPEV